MLDEVGGWIGDGRGVHEWDVSETVGSGWVGAEDGLLEGWAGWLKKYECFGELRASIGDDDGENTAL